MRKRRWIEMAISAVLGAILGVIAQELHEEWKKPPLPSELLRYEAGCYFAENEPSFHMIIAHDQDSRVLLGNRCWVLREALGTLHLYNPRTGKNAGRVWLKEGPEGTIEVRIDHDFGERTYSAERVR